jgi:hypothetical protein
MKFNGMQTEGLARVSDNLATSSIIGSVLGITGHSPLSIAEIAVLMTAALALVGYSLILRREK